MGSMIIGKTSCWTVASAIFFAYVLSQIKNDGKERTREISDPKEYNPCCDFPCLNLGVCMDLPNNTYYCDCAGTEHYGLNCHIPTWSKFIRKILKPSPETVHHILTVYETLFWFINKIEPLQKSLMKYVYMTRGSIVDSPPRYESDHHYLTLDAYYNETYYARELPPIPSDCPTPMGAKGPKKLLPTAELFNRIFLRQKFKPEPHYSNLMFQYYAQHFTHQFFRTNYTANGKLTLGKDGVDVSNIYGLTEDVRQSLRAKKNGKLKTSIINGEVFPPLLNEVDGVEMEYPNPSTGSDDIRFALGHPFFSLLPGLLVYATIWIREHNRVCDVLKREHPHWDDERLYQTARLIIVGEVIKITIEDYVQHLSQYKLNLTFDPELVHGTDFQFDNRIRTEFVTMYHWHPVGPDVVQVEGKSYSLMDLRFSNKAVLTHGFEKFVEAMTKNRAGALTIQNHPPVTETTFTKAMNNARSMRTAGFNEYRKRFGMEPYTSFEALTGEKEIAKELKDIYGHIDAVEFYVGLLAEAPGTAVTPVTMVNMGGPWSIKGLIANPICSPKWWKPSTFGGDVGFNIVKSASLKNLFCSNMKGPCDHIQFSVPESERN